MKPYSLLLRAGVWGAALIAAVQPVPAAGRDFASHPPTRPLPVGSQRKMPDAPGFFVDANSGKDTHDGTRDAPWRTVKHAVSQIKAGDVLYLREGVYYEHVALAVSGTSEKPITIRGYPGELAVIDGALREFVDRPEAAWEPAPDGAHLEYRSRRAYPDLIRVAGNFGDSLVPLHSYRRAADLRSTTEAPGEKRDGQRSPIYLGPGVTYDAESQ